jgi:hypothetical protein
MEGAHPEVYHASINALAGSLVHHVGWVVREENTRSINDLLGALLPFGIFGLFKGRTQKIIDASGVFFSHDPPNVMYERACESVNTCIFMTVSYVKGAIWAV